MSDLLNSASLVMIPSGYKEDVVYSQIPTDGSGDLSFTRASSGTRINSQGLVEVVPWNLLEYSEDFTNASWVKNNCSISSNAIIAPNGTTTADKLVEDTSTSIHRISQNQGSINGFFYAYAKAGERTKVAVNTSPVDVGFDLVNGTVINLGYGTTGASIVSVGNGWWRISLYLGVANSTYYLGLLDASNNQNYTGDGTSGAYFWGAQLNIGSTAKPYFPTTDRLNVPRLTYQNGGGGCPSLLLEKQSTNEAVYSNALATAPNVVDTSTTTANVYVSPDGTQNAMQFTETTANDRHGFYQYTTVTAQTYTASIFTKQTGRRYISFSSDMTDGVERASYFDLQTISVVSASSGYNCSIENFGNGWLRLIVTFTATAGSRYVIWGGSPNGSSTYYAGSTSISQTFYGYQLEASSYATSYIPTTSSSATRVADACYKTGISSLIGATEGVIFVDFNNVTNPEAGDYNMLATISDSANEYIYISKRNPTGIEVYGGTGASTYITSGVFVDGQRYKVALAYKNNDFALYINGNSIWTDTSGTLNVSTPNKFSLGSYYSQILNFNSGINQSALFKTRLTNAELASLTTI